MVNYLDQIFEGARSYAEEDLENRSQIIEALDKMDELVEAVKNLRDYQQGNYTQKSEPEHNPNVDFTPPLTKEDLEFFKTEELRLKQDVKNTILNSSNIFVQDKWWEDEKLLKDVIEDLSTALLG